MQQNQKDQKSELDQDAHVKDALKRLLDNKSDEIEDTFCFKLFELNYFDEALFLSMCADFDVVLKHGKISRENTKTLVWIISCIFRSIFSHLNIQDKYKIQNFNPEISSKWNETYLENLREFLAGIFEKTR